MPPNTTRNPPTSQSIRLYTFPKAFLRGTTSKTEMFSMRVIKRNRKREAFSRRKLERAIERAGREARVSRMERRHLARETARDVQRSFRRRQSVRSTEIRQRVLSRLGRRARSVAAAWRRYERRRRR